MRWHPRDFRTHSCFHCETQATRERVGFGVSDFVALRPTAHSSVRTPPPISLSSRTCRAIRFNLKSFNQCIQAALNQNVRPSRYLVCAKQFHLILHSAASLYSATCRPSLVSSYPPEHPTVAHPRTSRNELIRQSDEGRAAVYVYVYVYIPMSDEARRNSAASIYYNKRDVKWGRPNAGR